VNKDQLVKWVLEDILENVDLKGLQENQDLKVHKVRKESKVLQVLWVPQDHKVLRDHQELLALKEIWEFKDSQDL
jgi:hypothetical protein